MKKVTLFSNPISYLYVTCFFVCITGAVLVSMVYFSHLNEGRHDLRVEANVIESTLSEVFDQTSQLLFHIGKQISSYEKKDLEGISKIIGRDQDESFQVNNSLSWMTLGWIGLNNQLLYDWKYGFCNPPINLPVRSFVTKCAKEPWKLNLSKSTVSLMSGLREIPGGMGITNDKGLYLGTLSVGFSVAELNNKLQTGPHNLRISYIILDENLRIILQSSDNAIDPDSSYYKDLLENVSIFPGIEGLLSSAISYKNITGLCS